MLKICDNILNCIIDVNYRITVAKSSPEKNETDERDWTMVSESNKNLNIESETLDVIPDKNNDDKPFFDFFMPLNELIVIKK